MSKKTVTVDGEFDDMFIDDRDDRIAAMSIDATTPRYGANDLKRPKRALNEAEREAMDQIGIPPQKRA